MRYLASLAYDGSAYHGWQRQPNATTIQQVLEEAFSLLLSSPTQLVGCGRTDTGVHANHYVAHFDSDMAIASCDDLCYKLNSYLPSDIVIHTIRPVGDDFHARFSALSRSYEYHIAIKKSPFLKQYAWQCRFALDFDKMNSAAKRLLEYQDFTSFSKLHTDAKTNLCNVTEAHWKQKSDNHWVFYISANRFLRNMVRAIVGTLLEVGKGKITEQQFCEIIEQKDRSKAGKSVAAQGLSLTAVVY